MADFYAAIIQSTVPASNGLVQYKTPNLGGKTPKAAIGIINEGEALGTEAANWRRGFGFTDGTNQNVSSISSLDGQSSVTVERGYKTDRFIERVPGSGGSTFDSGAFNAWLSDTGDGQTGIEIDWSNVASTECIFTLILFAGDDLSAHVGSVNPPASGSKDITAPGFQPDMAIFHGVGAAPGADEFFYTSIGIAYDNGTSIDNWVWTAKDESGASSSQMQMELSTAGVAEQFGSWTVSAGSFDSSGFSLTNQAGDPGSDEIGYLALKITNGSVWAGVIDTPTATGDHSETGPGFQPNFVGIFETMLTGVSTTAVTDSKAGSFGIAHFTPDLEYCAAFWNEVGASTTNNASLFENQAVTLKNDVGTDVFNASFVSMDSGGWTLNYSTADSTVRKWLAFALSDGSGSGTTATDSALLTSVGISSLSGTETGTAQDTATLTSVDATVIQGESTTPSSYTLYGTGDFDRACCDVAASSISGNTINIVPQGYNGYWRCFLFKLTGASGTQPTFSIDWDNTYSHYNTSSSSLSGRDWMPCYTYDVDDVNSWNFATSYTVNSGYVDFQFDNAFSQDTVYVAFFPVVRPSGIPTWISSLSGISETQSSLNFGGDAYQVGSVPSTTDVNGRTIPETKQYGFTFGTGSKQVVIFSGIHAGEDVSDIVLMKEVEWLLSEHPIAVEARANATFYVYPLLNVQGRWGGHYRITFESSVDPNRDWDDSTGFSLVTTTNIKNAVSTDVGFTNVDIFNDHHTKEEWGLILHQQSDPLPTALQDWFDEYNECTDVGDERSSSSNSGTVVGYFYSNGTVVAMTVETGEEWGEQTIHIAERHGVGCAVANSVGLYTANTSTKRNILDFGDGNSSRHYEISNNNILDLPNGEWGIAFWTRIDTNSGSEYQYAIGFGGFGTASSFYFYYDTVDGEWNLNIVDDNGNGTGTVKFGTHGADSTERLWIIRAKYVRWNLTQDLRVEVFSATPGNNPVKETGIDTPPWTAPITCPGKLYIGTRSDLDNARYFEEHLGGLIWKNDGPIEYEDMKSLGWGLLNGDDTGLLTSTPNMCFPMTSPDSTLTDTISGITATQVGTGWPSPSVEVVYRTSTTTSTDGAFLTSVSVSSLTSAETAAATDNAELISVVTSTLSDNPVAHGLLTVVATSTFQSTEEAVGGWRTLLGAAQVKNKWSRIASSYPETWRRQ